ncbi:MAG: hypothetical protein ABIT36_03455 [Steroidobacteraceae bacterium]
MGAAVGLMRAAWLAVTLITWPAYAAQPPAGNCNTDAHHQLDFWIGDWSVTHSDGKAAGENRIASVAGGCALYESWAGEGGISGHSLTFYDGLARKWRQHWIDNTGSSLDLAGSKVGNSILLLGETQELSGTVLQRLTLTPAEGGSVRQLWESSADGGKRWKTEFDGRYVRKR